MKHNAINNIDHTIIAKNKYELFNEDCVFAIKRMIIDGIKVPLIIMDPPYDIKNTNVGENAKSKKKFQKYLTEIQSSSLTDGINYDEILPMLAKLQNNINIYIWCNKEQIPHYINFYQKYECSFDILKWVKTNAMPMYSNKYMNDTEYCLYFRKDAYCKPGNYKDASTLYQAPINTKDKNLWGHPTIKPVEILDRLIRNSSQEGDLIFDPYMGSGSTGVSALKNKRNFIGCEINKEYFEISQKRLKEDDQLVAA